MLNDHESSVTCHFIHKIRDEGVEDKQQAVVSLTLRLTLV